MARINLLLATKISRLAGQIRGRPACQFDGLILAVEKSKRVDVGCELHLRRVGLIRGIEHDATFLAIAVRQVATFVGDVKERKRGCVVGVPEKDDGSRIRHAGQGFELWRW